MPLPKPDRGQLAVGVGVAIAVAIVGGLAWGFGQQLVLARQMRIEESHLEDIVAAEQARHEELAAQLEYAQSDEYVEQWARAEARMAQPGEVVVIVLRDWDEEPTDDALPTPTPEPEAKPFWVEWWELIFPPSGR
jgi:cell division protein FtsB